MLLCHFHICLPLNRNSEKQIHGKEKLYIYRRQVTIHKCQGFSLDCVIVDLYMSDQQIYNKMQTRSQQLFMCGYVGEKLYVLLCTQDTNFV